MAETCLFVFAGTAEGRIFIERLRERTGNSRRLVVFTATEYGAGLLEGQGCEIRSGKLDSRQMAAEIKKARPRFVIDATHPYAAEAGKNIKAACEETGIPYVRLGRENSGNMQRCEEKGEVVFVNSSREAAAYLQDKEGGILLAAGIKAAEFFSGESLRDRVFPRVLPLEESLKTCSALGFPLRNIIAMQGPFSKEMNRACLRHTGASWLVTKRCGKTGGYEEKLRAAAAEHAGVVVIKPPKQDPGYSLEDVLYMVTEGQTGTPVREAADKTVFLIGAGTGSPGLLTGEAMEALLRCQCVIGADRIITAYENLLKTKKRKTLFDGEQIAAYIGQSGYRVFSVLLSGDGGFYSLARTLMPIIRGRGWNFSVLPGISSLSFLAARLGIAWENIKTVSLHGRDENAANVIVGNVMHHRQTFFLTGDKTGPREICQILKDQSLESLHVVVGENLSMSDERLCRGRAVEFVDAAFAPLSVMLVENPAPLEDSVKNTGYRDGIFIRGGETPVPMTKEEIRVLSVSRLCINSKDVVWDIGAGTGSISCAAALCAGYGRVYAVERDEAALQLIGKNRNALGLFNIEIIAGIAPKVLETLPAPDCVFIGGSGGSLGSILDLTFAKNPASRIVLTAITMETLGDAAAETRRLSAKDLEITQVAVSRAVQAGNHHLLKAENPVFIVSFKGGGA
ncbi:MAG: precorrin-6A reductase [Treponema sp.]|jgi:precorrin-6Y C5,15-methyltransferase (decarboxylating)|nr:precorrin-6A reductase [Treponema sp.]